MDAARRTRGSDANIFAKSFGELSRPASGGFEQHVDRRCPDWKRETVRGTVVERAAVLAPLNTPLLYSSANISVGKRLGARLPVKGFETAPDNYAVCCCSDWLAATRRCGARRECGRGGTER